MIPSKQEWFQALAARHGQAMQQAFSSAAVAICGLGGLGSNIAIALARAGIGKLILIDFDRVDVTNLHRQQYKANQVGQFKALALADNLREIAPYLEIQAICQKVTEENLPQLVSGAQIVCEAFDQPEAKAMLANALLEQTDCILVAASGMAGMGSPNEIHTRKISNHFYLCGDECSDISGPMGLVAPRVMLCAAHQAHTVLRILAGLE